jgi:hypothetical protein
LVNLGNVLKNETPGLNTYEPLRCGTVCLNYLCDCWWSFSLTVCYGVEMMGLEIKFENRMFIVTEDDKIVKIYPIEKAKEIILDYYDQLDW